MDRAMETADTTTQSDAHAAAEPSEDEQIKRELEQLLVELEAVKAQRDKEESLKTNLELEIADLKVTLEDKADELYKSAQRRRHEAEAAHKSAVRRQQETLDAMTALVQQEKQLKKIAKSMGIKDVDQISPFVQFMSRLRKTNTAPATPASRDVATAPVTTMTESHGSRPETMPGSVSGKARFGFQRHPSRQKLTELMRQRAREAQADPVVRKPSSPLPARKQTPTETAAGSSRPSGSKLTSGWQSLMPTKAAPDSELKRQPYATDLTATDGEEPDAGLGSAASDSSLAHACPEHCDPKAWAEFLDVYDARGTMPVDKLYALPYLKRCVATDITTCLRSCKIADPAHWFAMLLANQLIIEPDLNPGERVCGVTGQTGWSTHRYQLGGQGAWQPVSEAAMSRLVVVADFVVYTRHVAQGLVTDRPQGVHAELVRKLLNMAAVRMGLAVLRPLHNA